MARRRLPRMIFDYIDGAAGTGYGELLNLSALANVRLKQRVLVDVSIRDLSVPVFENKCLLPFGVSPMAMCNLAAPHADRDMARLSARYKTPFGVSTLSSSTLEQLLEWSEGCAWFQLYFSGDGTQTFKLLDRAKQAGYRNLVLTLDVPEVARRPLDQRNGFTIPFRIGPRQLFDLLSHPRWTLGQVIAGLPEMANFAAEGFHFERTASRGKADWTTLRQIRDRWPGKLIAKGITSLDDALRLRQEGVDAIQVSGHGGRQLDALPPPILQLGAIRKAIGHEYPIFYDSGIRSGEDIVKAYAMGASFVFLGRSMQYAAAAGSRAGLEQWWKTLSDDVSITLALLGKTGLAGLVDSALAEGAFAARP
jgi:L-lactate dehydrogenase (cytochrome)